MAADPLRYDTEQASITSASLGQSDGVAVAGSAGGFRLSSPSVSPHPPVFSLFFPLARLPSDIIPLVLTFLSAQDIDDSHIYAMNHVWLRCVRAHMQEREVAMRAHLLVGAAVVLHICPFLIFP
jgi:hypothetical protein